MTRYATDWTTRITATLALALAAGRKGQSKGCGDAGRPVGGVTGHARLLKS